MLGVSNDISGQGKSMRVKFLRFWNKLQVFWDILNKSDLSLLATSLSFSSVLSLIPLLAVSLSVFSALGGMGQISDQIRQLFLHYAVGGASESVGKVVLATLESVHFKTLGVTGVVGLLFTSTRLFMDMDSAVHRIWGIPQSRAWWRSLLIYWSILFLGPLLLAGVVGLIGSKDAALFSELPNRTIGFVLIWFALFVVCKWVPSRKVDTRPAFWCSLAASISFLCLQEFYTRLTSSILNYNKLYGSLAAVPIFLMWIWLHWQLSLSAVVGCSQWQQCIDKNDQEAKLQLKGSPSPH